MTKVPLFYDGSRGAIHVSLRNRTSALVFDGPGIRSVAEGDVQDLLSPILGGNAFHRAAPAAAIAAELGLTVEDLQALAAEITLLDYAAPGTEELAAYVALTPATKDRLAKLKPVQPAVPLSVSSVPVLDRPSAAPAAPRKAPRKEVKP